jgi:hypothetical protein
MLKKESKKPRTIRTMDASALSAVRGGLNFAKIEMGVVDPTTSTEYIKIGHDL